MRDDMVPYFAHAALRLEIQHGHWSRCRGAATQRDLHTGGDAEATERRRSAERRKPKQEGRKCAAHKSTGTTKMMRFTAEPWRFPPRRCHTGGGRFILLPRFPVHRVHLPQWSEENRHGVLGTAVPLDIPPLLPHLLTGVPPEGIMPTKKDCGCGLASWCANQMPGPPVGLLACLAPKRFEAQLSSF